MEKEPVLILLGGLGAVIAAALVATNTLGWTNLDAAETSAIVVFIAAITGFISAAVRGEVWSPASHNAAVAEARRGVVPGPGIIATDEDGPE